MRMKVLLVAHLGAFFDPVAQVHIRQVQAAGQLDLPQDAVGAVAGLRVVGFVEGINGREALGEQVNDGDHHQSILGPGVAKFDQAGFNMAIQQKLTVLRNAVVVHAAAGVAGFFIALVQGVMRRVVVQPLDAGLQVPVALPSAALAAAGLKVRHHNAQ